MKKKSLLILLSVFIVAFFLNLLWEVIHSLLYDWSAVPLENDISFYVGWILLSTLGDGLYIVAIFLINSTFRKRFSWALNPRKQDYLIIAVLGIIFAIFIEVKAQLLGKWQYTDLMPTIFGIGLTPLIQLALTGILTIFIIHIVVKNK